MLAFLAPPPPQSGIVSLRRRALCLRRYVCFTKPWMLDLNWSTDLNTTLCGTEGPRPKKGEILELSFFVTHWPLPESGVIGMKSTRGNISNQCIRWGRLSC
jgi:hypothetical protein